MLPIKEKNICSGCMACVQSCPYHCISIKTDNEGFDYPEIDDSVCAKCGLCEKVCPIHANKNSRYPLNVYAAKNKNESILMRSSSGGVFYAIAKSIIDNNGVVFGAKYNEKWEVVHSYVTNEQDLHNFLGSKYAQSKIGSAYKDVEQLIKRGIKVLFSGTPCQIGGLRSFLNKKQVEIGNNLICLDMICHGVPSPKVWQMYLHAVNKNRPSVKSINMRDKSSGWETYSFCISYTDDSKVCECLDDNLFRRGFLKDIYLRPSCHKCAFRNLRSGSDITLADFWIVKKYTNNQSFMDNKGVSMVLCNTSHGDSTIKEISIDLELEKISDYRLEKLSKYLVKSPTCSPFRQKFFQSLKSSDILSNIEKYAKLPISKKIKNHIVSMLVKIRDLICKR